MGSAPGAGAPAASVGMRWVWKARNSPMIAIGEREDQAAIVKGAVVVFEVPEVSLVHVDVVDAVQAVGVAELDVDRLVQVLVELRAECEDLAARGLALFEEERQQILKVVGARRAARRQHAPIAKSNSGALTKSSAWLALPARVVNPCGRPASESSSGCPTSGSTIQNARCDPPFDWTFTAIRHGCPLSSSTRICRCGLRRCPRA